MHRGKIVTVRGERISSNYDHSKNHPLNEDDPLDSPRHRSIYLLPNLLTTAALFSGFYAIVAAMSGKFEQASIAIFVAMIMDTLDGRVARLTKTQTPFGAQYDSLSDMVSFGLTPALVVYYWALSPLGKLGWIASFIYVAATALRLARFNIQSSTDKRFFIGLPCPAAAAVLASLVWIITEHQVRIDAAHLKVTIGVLAITLGLLMVSNIRFYSFKEIDFKNHVPFMAALAVVLVMGLIAFAPAIVLFLGFVLYALSGPVFWVISCLKRNI